MLYYYIMVDPDKPNKCKLGITGDPPGRMRAYKTAAPNAYYLAVYVIPDRVHERRILEIMWRVARVQSEYVHCDPSIVRNIVESYFMDHDIHY
jgi:hypothetical protein